MKNGKLPADNEMSVPAEKLLKRIDKSVEDGLMTPEIANRLRQAIMGTDDTVVDRTGLKRKRG